MTRELMLAAAALSLLAAPALAQDTGDHGHDHGAAADAHAHDAGAPTVAVTRWSETMELFLEYPVPVAGEPGRFVIHLTILDGFQPVRGGVTTLAFRREDGSEVRFQAIVRMDTPVEVEYSRNGGVLHTILRRMAGSG